LYHISDYLYLKSLTTHKRHSHF